MINYDLSKIRAVVFDVDGVLSEETIPLHPSGEPMRTVNIKDGYAIQLACKSGLRIERLGVEYLYHNCMDKIAAIDDFCRRAGVNIENTIYMGDDIPDYEIMCRCGCPCCPSDACPDIKAVSRYVSHVPGGRGCGRDILEQVLRAQGKWLSGNEAFGW